MYTFGEELIIEGDIAAIWEVATDVAAWPSWDPHEEKARLDGPFAAGTKGWNKPKGAPGGGFTITAVEPERAWSARAIARTTPPSTRRAAPVVAAARSLHT